MHISGLVLCGGFSSRMGTDKALLESTGGKWAEIAAGKLSELQLPVKYSVHAGQHRQFTRLFPQRELIVDDPQLDVKGPLLGILSAYQQDPGKDLFVLACDLPLMVTPLLKELLRLYQEQPAAAYFFTNEGHAEPLCAIYTSQGLQKIQDMVGAGTLKKFSMKYALEQLHVRTIPLNEADKKYFKNFNAHADLNGH
ncbi:molybdenum cofactor guanylyltransferase [Niabella terrae]